MPADLTQHDNADDAPDAVGDEFEAAFAAAARAEAKPAPSARPADVQSTGDAPGATDAQPGQAGASDPNPRQTQDAPSELDQLRAENRRLDEQLAQALHRERSVAGRISASDQRAARLQQRVTELEQQLQQAQQRGSGEADVLAESPELEAAIQRRIADATRDLQARLDMATAATANDQPAAQQRPPADEQQRQQTIAATAAALDKAFPAWRAHTASSQFARWLGQQPQAVQNSFTYAIDYPTAAGVMAAFYRDHPSLQQTQTTARPPAGAAPNRITQAAGLAPRSSTPASVAPGQPAAADDFDAAFNARARQLRS